jgi:hypothetical protein
MSACPLINWHIMADQDRFCSNHEIAPASKLETIAVPDGVRKTVKDDMIRRNVLAWSAESF